MSGAVDLSCKSLELFLSLPSPGSKHECVIFFHHVTKRRHPFPGCARARAPQFASPRRARRRTPPRSGCPGTRGTRREAQRASCRPLRRPPGPLRSGRRRLETQRDMPTQHNTKRVVGDLRLVPERLPGSTKHTRHGGQDFVDLVDSTFTMKK